MCVCVCVVGGLLKLSLFRGRGFRICRLVTDRDEEHPTDTSLSLYTHLSVFSEKVFFFSLSLCEPTMYMLSHAFVILFWSDFFLS